jgi:hypothetical protein
MHFIHIELFRKMLLHAETRPSNETHLATDSATVHSENSALYQRIF